MNKHVRTITSYFPPKAQPGDVGESKMGWARLECESPQLSAYPELTFAFSSGGEVMTATLALRDVLSLQRLFNNAVADLTKARP